ncbi:hypothetical protein DL767_002389 [Monosporascus sp. MG133]|nr:hypothetical protein DL767_002389 [Monosporascus sp. MG133]
MSYKQTRYEPQISDGLTGASGQDENDGGGSSSSRRARAEVVDDRQAQQQSDYAMSYWCAEVCNTLTNVLFLWLGCRGIRSAYRNCHPSVFVVGFVGYTVVGLGSTLFHATLKYPMQLARYYATKDPQFHQDAYAILTAIVVFSNMFIMEYSVRPALQSRDRKRAPNSPVQNSNVILKEMWLMVATGLSIFLGGYLIWHLENVYCDRVRQWRHYLQLPWAVILEGHAWWHIMTGIGGELRRLVLWRPAEERN